MTEIEFNSTNVDMLSSSTKNVTSRKRTNKSNTSSTSTLPPLSPARNKYRRTPLSPLPILPSSVSSSSNQAKYGLNVSFDASVSSPKGKEHNGNGDSRVLKPFEIHLPMEWHLSAATLKSAFLQMATDEYSHQYSLHTSKCNQLSLSEVIIPSLFRSLKKDLKRMQGRAKGRRDLIAVEELKMIRLLVKSCETNAILAVENTRIGRSEMNKLARDEKKKEMLLLKEQYQQDKKRVEESKLIEKQKRKQERREEAKRRYVKNQDWWREVAGLMTDLAVLQREEKIWKLSAPTLIDQMEKEMNHVYSSEGLDETSSSVMELSGIRERCNTMDAVQSLVDNITMSSNRIIEALGDISSLIDEAKCVQEDLYDIYKKDFKLKNYFGSKDDKALVRFLTM